MLTTELPPPSVRVAPLRFAGAPPPERFRAVVVTTADACEPLVADWADLAADSIEPNVFYEPWALLPAIRRLGPFPSQRFVFFFAPSIADPSREVLCGFFPLQRCRTETAVSLTVTGLFRHPFCYVRTPLLRARYARECLSAFFDWLSSGGDETGLFELSEVVSDGPFRQLLADELYRRGTLTFPVQTHTRALFRPLGSAEAYLQQALSGRHRRDLGRKERRLRDVGRVDYDVVEGPGEAESWIDDFLRLEASGWKGRSGTALAAEPHRQAFFREVVRGAAERGRLLGLRLRVGGSLAAERLSFRAAGGAMAFRVAYDEELARYSPGLLLEVENIRRMHRGASPSAPGGHPISWMDCGAVPYSDLFNRVWIHRRTIETMLLSTGRVSGAFLLSVLPLLRFVNRTLDAGGLGRRAASTDEEDARLAKGEE